MSRAHQEAHTVHRIGWLRAAVLGANDGLVSTSSLVVGVASAGSDRTSILLAGLAGLVAGTMSMAAGEYVSVSSQLDESTQIYASRCLDQPLAREVATQLMAKDALAAMNWASRKPSLPDRFRQRSSFSALWAHKRAAPLC